jgi:acetyl esterase/lipase
VTLERGIVFGKGGTQELHLDLARPRQQEGPLPAVVCIHGGGWVAGGREQMEKTIQVLASRGYVAVAPDYRLAPAARFPAAIEDCKAAVRWLRANAERYQVRSDRIGAMGFAAGGHLACLLGLTERGDRLEGQGGHAEQLSRVQAVVSLFGPTDLTQPGWSEEALRQNLVPFLGGTPLQKSEAYRKASPLTYAGRKNPPPFLLVHGTEDRLVPFKQVQDLADRLQQVGGSVRILPLVGAGHASSDRQQQRESIARMLLFFDDNLKP